MGEEGKGEVQRLTENQVFTFNENVHQIDHAIILFNF
jgi:hypothetical protein